jgi:kynurenine formamidase
MTGPVEYTDGPREWERWGPGDQIGRANLLTPERVLTAARCIRSGRRFSLALPLAAPGGDPCLPGRPGTDHRMLRDHCDYVAGTVADSVGGGRYSDDWLGLACHGTTHMDALGHAYAGEELWGGVAASSTAGGLDHADIAALAHKAVVGRAVLVDVPRHRGVDRVPRGEWIRVGEVREILHDRGVNVGGGDSLLIRTGTAPFFDADRGADGTWDVQEPGLTYERDLIDFVRETDLCSIGTDTLSNELAFSTTLRVDYPLHVALQRNLGVLFHEALWLEDWAADCASDGVDEAFYVAAPLRLSGGTGGPMNPVVVK